MLRLSPLTPKASRILKWLCFLVLMRQGKPKKASRFQGFTCAANQLTLIAFPSLLNVALWFSIIPPDFWCIYAIINLAVSFHWPGLEFPASVARTSLPRWVHVEVARTCVRINANPCWHYSRSFYCLFTWLYYTGMQNGSKPAFSWLWKALVQREVLILVLWTQFDSREREAGFHAVRSRNVCLLRSYGQVMVYCTCIEFHCFLDTNSMCMNLYAGIYINQMFSIYNKHWCSYRALCKM